LECARYGRFLVGAWAAAICARVLFGLVGDLDGVLLIVLTVIATALGALASVPAARRLAPLSARERRDVVLGWGALVAGVAVVACLFLPLPWGVLAALAVLITAVCALRLLARRSSGQSA
jgi:hypothetical protein